MAQDSTSGTAPATYTERLIVPWWSWPIALGLAALLSAEVLLGASTWLVWVPYAILLPATAAGLVAAGRVRIRIAGDELAVDDARLSMAFVTEVNILNGEAKRALLGPLAAPYAFAVQRPWIRGAVRVVIDDPADPTPYWIISTRRPAALAAAIVAGRAAELDASIRQPSTAEAPSSPTHPADAG